MITSESSGQILACVKRNPKLSVGTSKVVFKREEIDVYGFKISYRVNVPTVGGCETVLDGERMENMKQFKYIKTSVIHVWRNGRNK